MKPQNTKTPTTRPAVKPELAFPTFDTLEQAASVSGVPLAVLKRAKRDGCPAFRHTRVYFGEFLAWFFKQEAPDLEISPKDRLALAQAKKVERENREAEGELVRMGEVEQLLTESIVLPLSSALLEMPAALAPLCNPTAIEETRKTIERYIENRVKPQLRDKLPKPERKK